MNFTESFSEFSSKLTPMDLALYAGAGIVLWVIFKDNLSPVQKIILDIVTKIKGYGAIGVKPTPFVSTPTNNDTNLIKDGDVFFDLVVSWKQTRDLAERSGCTKAVEVADQMFPYLSPTVCAGENNDTK
jgi:hypothetical protein